MLDAIAIAAQSLIVLLYAVLAVTFGTRGYRATYIGFTVVTGFVLWRLIV